MQPRRDTPLPVVKVDSTRIPAADQFEVWHESTTPLFDTGRAGEGCFTAGATCYLVDSLLFTRVHFGRMRFRREQRHLSHGESDSITLQFYRTGSVKGQLDDGTSLHMGPDRISLHDFSHCYTGIGETSEQYAIVIPRHLIASHDRIRRRSPMFSWPLDSPAGRLLNGALSQIWQELPRASIEDASTICSGLVGLLNGLLAGTPTPDERAEIERAGLAAMKRYLNAQLHCANLGVDELCRVFNCSRATLYRLFQPYGGVKTYIRDLRIGRCFQELALCGRERNERVRDVAERWGFTDLSHFHRLFKQRYGLTASEVMAAPVVNGSVEGERIGSSGSYAEVERLRGWLECF